jgi:molybdopterin/thiamine biosynthesis adenylyltransferase
MFYTDCNELLHFDDSPLQMSSLLGTELVNKLRKLNLFMVGCGAIGCELLKNFAMLNIGVEGSITITDPDHIETSNLNR